jgi:[glutamine synthetase] adenylyltransferase / [glutamine synthetase]-adenylyl-L-tyrosine phosphorylase
MSLKSLATYSQKELERAESFSSVFAIYRKIAESNHENLSEKLRIQRNKIFLECGLASLHETATAQQVCKYWSDQADQWLIEAFNATFDPNEAALFAMGKLGAGELNLSSDVDLIFVRSDTSNEGMKGLREFQQLIAERTDKGFVFRVDLNLRPGGKQSASVPTVSEFENHYTTKGETWERLAQVRMRPLCGSSAVINSVLDFSSKFIFRKHLDYTLTEDLQRLRSSIRSEYEIPVEPSFHLKLQPGGIRDIELFVNALQVIHGGKAPELRTHSTTEALRLLQKKQLLPAYDCKFLEEQYWYLRQKENLVQFQSDRQTHIYAATEVEVRPIKFNLERVEKLVTTLLGPIGGKGVRMPAKIPDQIEWLRSLNFSEQIIQDAWIPLWNLEAKSQHAQRDEEQRQIFLHSFIESLSEYGIDKDTGLSMLHEFVKATRAKATLFSTLNHKPKLIDDLARLFSISPYIGGVICRKPELLDSYILRSVADSTDDLETTLDSLYDRKLLTEIFLIPKYLENLDLGEILSGISENADFTARELLNILKTSMSVGDVSLLALGKWGGRELGLRSDLDFVFLTDDQPTEKHFKIARRFVNLLTSPNKSGPLYSVDLRLRPSGSAGPVMVSKKNLGAYLLKEAHPWELQAYTRARIIEASAGQPSDLSWLPPPRKLNKIDFDLLWEIREKIVKDTDDFKFTPGGLLDIELHTQTAYLKAFAGNSPSLSAQVLSLAEKDPEWMSLFKNYEVLRSLEQLLHICTERSTSVWDPQHPAANLVARASKKSVGEVSQVMKTTLQANRELLKRLDPYERQK